MFDVIQLLAHAWRPIPTPDPPDYVHADMFGIHSPPTVEVPALFQIHSELLCPLPADVSLTAPRAENAISSSTKIDPLIVNVLSLC